MYCGVGRTAPGAGDICVCDVFGGAETVLTKGEGFNDGPEFSPDGKSIWFNSTRTGRMQLFCMDPDGQNVRRVRRSGQNDWFAHFSPDGTAVAFLSYDEPPADPASHPPGKQVRLQLMDPAGQNLRTVARLLGGQGTLNVNSFSPDGGEFAFVGYASKAHLPRNLRQTKES